MKKLSFLFAILALMSVAACNRTDDNDMQREEDSVLERSGENTQEGMEEVRDEMEDAADEVKDEADDAN